MDSISDITLVKKELDDGYIIFANSQQERRKVGHITGGFEGKKLTIDNIQIEEKFRSKGIGSGLIRATIALARDRGVETIEGKLVPEYGENVEETKKFYQKMGFSVDKNGKLLLQFRS